MKITVNINWLCDGLVAALAGLLPLSVAQAHCFVGIRFLPATINIDDPCVADELSLPTVSRSKTGDVPPATELHLSGDISKRITENLGITIGTDWTRLDTPSSPRTSGFGNLGTTVQYQFVNNAPHEFAMSAGIGVEWGGTGAKALADS